MKPEDLIPPFPKNERKILIHDRIWYSPDPHLAENRFEFPGWHDPSLFGNLNPVCIEYCSGNGGWIASQAIKNPQINWVAIEKKFMRVRKIWSKIKNLKLSNLIVICGEAQRVTQNYIPDATISNIFINFPDPWPKKRHAKHRLLQPSFIQELARIMKVEKTITFVTDDINYSEEVINHFLSDLSFKPAYSKPYFITNEEDYGTSYFEDLWRSKGKTIQYHRFIKK